MIKSLRAKKHQTIRRVVVGTGSRPRLTVFRSGKHIYAQLVDDSKGETLLHVSDLKERGSKKERAYNVGKTIAMGVLKTKIKTVVFDRGGFLYHGRIAEVARGAREGGLKF